MSGGHFDYKQYHFNQIANSIEDYIEGEPLEEEDINYVIDSGFCDKEEEAYIREHKHTLPNCYGYSEATLAEMRKGIEIIRKASIYAQRIDWLLSGDDDEEDFKVRLKEDLDTLI